MNFDEWLTESVVNANGPSHSLLSLNGRKHLGRVLESDWSFSQGVADGEEVDESSGRKQVISKIQNVNIIDKLTRQLVQFVPHGYHHVSEETDQQLTKRCTFRGKSSWRKESVS
jgi:hypothetical protein